VHQPRKTLALMTGLIVIYVLITLNWLVGAPSAEGTHFVRLSSPRIGAILVAAAQLIPAIIFGYAVDRFTGWRRVVGVVVTLPILLVSLPLLFVTAVDSAGVLLQGYSNAMIPLGRTDLRNGRVSLYQTNFGATTAYGVLLRHDRQLIPGLRWTRNVKGWYPAETGKLIRVGDNAVVVEGVNGPATFTFGP
jgi:hypothetical protein